ncbi:hypothetical protein [Paenibacillus sp. 22594]|uniref:hypothetical protein n=1 Tax=Paenibacillus sp. 22594 TaxID=3453947 RepID=UPI003F863647
MERSLSLVCNDFWHNNLSPDDQETLDLSGLFCCSRNYTIQKNVDSSEEKGRGDEHEKPRNVEETRNHKADPKRPLSWVHGNAWTSPARGPSQ